MFTRLGNLVVKQRIWIILSWVAAALLLYFLAPSLSEVGTVSESNFLPRDSESLRARELMGQYFPQSRATSTATLVFYNPGKLGEADLAFAREVESWLSSGGPPFEVENVVSIFDNPELKDRLMSPDKTTMLMNIGLKEAAFESESVNTAAAIRDYLKSAPEGLEVYVSGQVGVYSDLFESLNLSISLTTLITIILVVVLLIFIYRSPVAALVPLATIGLAYLVARGAMGLLGQAGVPVWSQIDVFLIVLVFGIGTDYCLFLVSRFREEAGRNRERSEAMVFSVSKIGTVITASAFAVIVGLAGMAVARYQMIQTMGPALGAAILITLLAALTLAPALASIFGTRLFWPRHDRLNSTERIEHRGLWHRLGALTTGRPVPVAAGVLVLMLLPYLALPGLSRSFDQLSEIPPDSESVSGFRRLQEHYNIGEMEPLSVILVAPEGRTADRPEYLEILEKMDNNLRSLPNVVKVQSIVRPDGKAEAPAQLTVSGQLALILEGTNPLFSGKAADPAVLFSDEVTQRLTRVSTYLEELGKNFPLVAEEAAYQGLLSDLQSLQQAIQGIKTPALVENQLRSLSTGIERMGQSAGSAGTAIPPEAGQMLEMLDGYLAELAARYPAVTEKESYKEVSGTVSLFRSFLSQTGSLPQEQLAVLMPEMAAGAQRLSSGLSELASEFHNSSDYLFSETLARVTGDSSPLKSLETLFNSISSKLQSLSALFEQNGNPVFLSPALMSDSQEFRDLAEVFFSQDRRATIFYVVLDAFPQSDAALTSVEQVRRSLRSSLEDTFFEGEAAVGGTSAELADVRQVLDADFKRVMAVVLAAIFIVLLLLLRSVVAPVYLLLTVLLSYGTTLGLVSWIFQGLLGQEGISFIIPIIVFVLLVALGSDYNIFLISRVKEEAAKSSTLPGTRLAVIATGGVITACGIILAGTFGALVVTPIRTLMQIGVAVAAGVLIDTFVVRALLVPAITSLLGRWNWWPRRQS